MASRFTALAVNSGEAFLLETEDRNGQFKRVLVDGGRQCKTHKALSRAIEAATPDDDRKDIDVVVCTHNDIDHAGGLCSFFKHWKADRGHAIGEVWLPGRWLTVVQRGLTDPEGYAAEIMKDYDRIAEESGGRPSAFERLLVQECEDLSQSDGEFDAILDADPDGEGDGWPFSEIERSGFEGEASAIFASAMRAGPPRRNFTRFITAGSNILEIAEQAILHGVSVRWFEAAPVLYGRRTPRGGLNGLLEPVSAVRASLRTQWSPQRLSEPLVNLHLTVQNVESLVFYRPETTEEPGVLFCADSRFAAGIEGPKKPFFDLPKPKPTRPILLTAPHHGSKTNNIAYEILSGWVNQNLCTQLMVRHGGYSISLTCELRFNGTFVANSSTRLYCTRCKECGYRGPEGVEFVTAGGKWTPSLDARPCEENTETHLKKHRAIQSLDHVGFPRKL